MNKNFLEKYGNKKKRSKLLPFVKDIQELLIHDATQSSILEYLEEEHKVVISQPVLSTFIKRYINNDPLSRRSKFLAAEKNQTLVTDSKEELPTKDPQKSSIFT